MEWLGDCYPCCLTAIVGCAPMLSPVHAPDFWIEFVPYWDSLDERFTGFELQAARAPSSPALEDETLIGVSSRQIIDIDYAVEKGARCLICTRVYADKSGFLIYTNVLKDAEKALVYAHARVKTVNSLCFPLAKLQLMKLHEDVMKLHGHCSRRYEDLKAS
jgi:hypothetical protein